MFFFISQEKGEQEFSPRHSGKSCRRNESNAAPPVITTHTFHTNATSSFCRGGTNKNLGGKKKKEEKQKRRAEALERGRETQPVLLGFNPFKQISGTIFSERPSAALASVLSGPFIVVSSGPRQVANIASNLQSSPLSRKSPENRADQYAAVCTKHLARLKV